jgi:hypothetical protein
MRRKSISDRDDRFKMLPVIRCARMSSSGVAERSAFDRSERPARGDQGRKASTWILLATVYAALQASLWFVVPTKNTPAIIAGAVIILLFIVADPIRRGETAGSVGLTGRNFVEAWRLLLWSTVGALALILLVYNLTPDAPRQGRFFRRFVQILPWALLQQSLLQATFNRRLTAVMGPGWRSSLVNGLFFAGMHLPGPLLTALTFLAGSFWSRVYQKRPNLLALVLCHAILSGTAQALLPSEWTHGFRVGPGYFRWR